MNTTSVSGVEVACAASERKTLIWDAPVRVFHWLMVLSFAGAYLTAESERWRLLHVTLGYTMAGLVGFRILWGLVGTRHARFTASCAARPRCSATCWRCCAANPSTTSATTRPARWPSSPCWR